MSVHLCGDLDQSNAETDWIRSTRITHPLKNQEQIKKTLEILGDQERKLLRMNYRRDSSHPKRIEIEAEIIGRNESIKKEKEK